MNSTIVAIGASTAGIDALAELFDATPADTGLAFIILQHAARGRTSILAEVLASHTTMQVEQIRTGDIPKANTVHVLPPGFHLLIKEGVLILKDSYVKHRLHLPIDLFFQSLAEDQGSNAYAVVLSGTGSDGTLGIEAIKTAGGVTFAQVTTNAEFPGIQNSAAETNLIDFKLAPKAIPAKLLKLEKWRKQVPILQSESAFAECRTDWRSSA